MSVYTQKNTIKRSRHELVSYAIIMFEYLLLLISTIILDKCANFVVKLLELK